MFLVLGLAITAEVAKVVAYESVCPLIMLSKVVDDIPRPMMKARSGSSIEPSPTKGIYTIRAPNEALIQKIGTTTKVVRHCSGIN